MPDLDIDQLNIRISSDSKTAEQSLTNLTAALTNLKDSLSKVGSSAKAVSKLADSFSRLKDSAKDIDLSGLASQLSTISRINIKDTGIASFINSMKNFDKVSKNLDFSAIQDLKTQLSGLSGVSSNVSELLKSTASFARASGKMQEAAQNFPGLASAIRDFFDSMAGVDVSDNTVRMAEALSQISQNGKKAGAAMQSVQTNTGSSVAVTSRAERVWKLFGDTLKETGSMLKDIGQSIASLAKNIGSGLVSGVKTLVSQFKQLTSASSGLKNLASNLKMLLGTFVGFYGIRSVFNWVKDAVTSGADVAETNHIIEATFGSLAKEVDDWSQTTMENYGIAENAAKRYAGTLGAVFQSSGVGMKESAEMSQRLVEIAGDLSSFYNIDTETVYTKLKSGMAGMVRPLRDVGIDLSVASLSAFALEQGITKSWQSMSQAEKIALRYQYILQATSVVNNDFKNTSGSLANALRTLRAYGQAITETFGDGLASALRHVVRWLNKVAAVVLKVAKVFATFMHTLFGKNISGGGAGLGLSEDDSPYEDVADDLGDAATSAGDTSDGLGDAADNARELAKSLSVLPFDELNQLNKDVENTGSSSSKPKNGGSSPGGLGDLGLPDMGMLDEAEKLFDMSKLPDAVNRWAQRIRKAFEAHDWIGLGREIAWGINKGLEKLYQILDPKNVEEKVLPWVRAFATTMNSLVDNINWDLLGRVLGRGLNDLFLIANTWLTSFGWENLGRKFAEGANGLVSEIRWDWLGQLFANGINSLWQRAYGFVSTFDWVTLGLSLSEALKNFVNKVDYDSISGTVREGLNGIIDATYAFINDISIKDAEDLGAKLSDAFNDVIGKVKWRKIGLTLKQTWNKAWALLKIAVKNLGKEGGGTGIGDAIHDALETAIAGVKTEDMTEAINTLVQKVSQDIIKVFGDTEMWYDLGYKIGGALSDIVGNKDTLKAAAGAINAIVDGLLAMFKGAIDALKDHKGEIGDSIASFLKELDWADILKIAAPIIGVKLAGAILTLKFTSITNALKLKLGLSLASGASEAAGSAATSGTVSGALSGFGTKLATLAGGNLAQSLSAWAGPLGILGVSLVGATLGNTPEARAEVARAKSALDSDLKEGKKNVENTLHGTGESVEKLTSEIAQQGIQRSSEFVNQLSIDMATLRNKGVITDEQFKAINKGIWSGNDTTIASAARLRDAWVNDDKDKIESTKKTADVVSMLGINIGNSTVLADGFTKAYSIVHQTVGNVKSVVELAKDKVSLFADSVSNSGTKANEASSLFTTYDTSVSGIFTKVETGTEWIKRMSDATKTSGDNASIAAQNQKNYNDAADKTPGIMDTVKSLLAGFATKLLNSFGVKTDYVAKAKEIPEGAGEGIEDGTPVATAAVATMAGAMLLAFTSKLGIQSPSTVFKNQANFIPQGIAEGITLGTQKVLNSITTLTSQMSKTFSTAVSNMTSQLNTGGSSMANGLAQGFQSGMSMFNPGSMLETSFSYALSSLRSVESEMYYAGMSIIQGLQNGLNSMHLSLPDITVSWDRYTYGDGGWFDLPSFSINWYAKGGLFTNPTIAGFGEAGDEAALPLENSRVMNRIANAIVDNSNGAFGIDEATLASAVAQGYVQAMMTNQGNQQQPIFNIVVKTEDNEVLARAVQRGQQSMDYRNNPTPRFSY